MHTFCFCVSLLFTATYLCSLTSYCFSAPQIGCIELFRQESLLSLANETSGTCGYLFIPYVFNLLWVPASSYLILFRLWTTNSLKSKTFASVALIFSAVFVIIAESIYIIQLFTIFPKVVQFQVIPPAYWSWTLDNQTSHAFFLNKLAYCFFGLSCGFLGLSYEFDDRTPDHKTPESSTNNTYTLNMFMRDLFLLHGCFALLALYGFLSETIVFELPLYFYYTFGLPPSFILYSWDCLEKIANTQRTERSAKVLLD